MILYLFNILENIGIIAIIITIICSICIFVTTIASITEYDDDEKENWKNSRKKLITPLIIATIIATFIPSKKEMATIYILNDKNVQETLKNIPELTKLTTEFLIENLKKE